MSHTPLPWFAVDDGFKGEPMMIIKAARIAGQEPGHEVAIVATGDNTQEMENANAAFIVRACNNHDKLVEAVQAISDATKREGEIDIAKAWKAIEQARTILAEVEK